MYKIFLLFNSQSLFDIKSGFEITAGHHCGGDFSEYFQPIRLKILWKVSPPQWWLAVISSPAKLMSNKEACEVDLPLEYSLIRIFSFFLCFVKSIVSGYKTRGPLSVLCSLGTKFYNEKLQNQQRWICDRIFCSRLSK